MSNYIEARLDRAAYLRVKGYRLEETVAVGHKLIAFSFHDHDGQARQTAEEFSRGGVAPAERLLDCFGDLKALMYRRKSSLNEGHENHEGHKTTRPHTRN